MQKIIFSSFPSLSCCLSSFSCWGLGDLLGVMGFVLVCRCVCLGIAWVECVRYCSMKRLFIMYHPNDSPALMLPGDELLWLR